MKVKSLYKPPVWNGECCCRHGDISQIQPSDHNPEGAFGTNHSFASPFSVWCPMTGSMVWKISGMQIRMNKTHPCLFIYFYVLLVNEMISICLYLRLVQRRLVIVHVDVWLFIYMFICSWFQHLSHFHLAEISYRLTKTFILFYNQT